MIPPLPPPRMMIVGEWFSGEDLLAYGRAVAEACAKLVDKSMSTGEPRDLAAAIREMAREIKY